MKKIDIAVGLLLVLLLAALVSASKPRDYHLRQFESIKTNFNSYQPSLSDRMRGINDNQAKWDYHLRKLQELGVVDHTNFLFASVPYTLESSKRIWLAAYSNFPTAVMFSAKHYATNDPGYGIRPYVLEVWDFPSNIQHWTTFVQANNH